MEIAQKKLVSFVFLLVVLFVAVSGCIPEGDGISSSRFYVPSGNDVTGAVTISGGISGGGGQLYWLAEALQDSGIIALVITPTDISTVDGWEKAHRDGVRLIKSNREIGDRLGKIGLMGFSMGGGAVINLGNMKDVKMVVSMAPFGPIPGSGYHAATMILTGTYDEIAAASMGKTAYDQIPNHIPKLYASLQRAHHFDWMSGSRLGSSLDFIIAWAKYYLNDDPSAYSVFASGSPNDLMDYQFNPGDESPDPDPDPNPGPCH